VWLNKRGLFVCRLEPFGVSGESKETGFLPQMLKEFRLDLCLTGELSSATTGAALRVDSGVLRAFFEMRIETISELTVATLLTARRRWRDSHHSAA
jgi:hypothetical protein